MRGPVPAERERESTRREPELLLLHHTENGPASTWVKSTTVMPSRGPRADRDDAMVLVGQQTRGIPLPAIACCAASHFAANAWRSPAHAAPLICRLGSWCTAPCGLGPPGLLRKPPGFRAALEANQPRPRVWGVVLWRSQAQALAVCGIGGWLSRHQAAISDASALRTQRPVPYTCHAPGFDHGRINT